jgi:hypothetical protein
VERVPCGEHDTLVKDLCGNLAYRFKQFDGLMSLPYKSNGKYHLAGKIAACPLTTCKKTIESTAGLLVNKKLPTCIVIPPLPWYLFTGCCPQTDHVKSSELEFINNF